MSKHDTTLKMATFPRHGHLVMSFLPYVFDLFRQKKLYPLQEEHVLVFRNKKYSGEECLIDATFLEDKNHFVTKVIDLLDFVQPDFLYFKNNSFVQSRNTLRTAGCPDFILEVWSDLNESYEKEMKHRVYSSSPKTEHWYIHQDSNIVECWLGNNQLPTQTLLAPLYMQDNTYFDLRHLAL